MSKKKEQILKSNITPNYIPVSFDKIVIRIKPITFIKKHTALFIEKLDKVNYSKTEQSITQDNTKIYEHSSRKPIGVQKSIAPTIKPSLDLNSEELMLLEQFLKLVSHDISAAGDKETNCTNSSQNRKKRKEPNQDTEYEDQISTRKRVKIKESKEISHIFNR